MAIFATFRMKINVSKYLTSILPKSDDYNIFIKKYLEGGMENGKFFVMLKKKSFLKNWAIQFLQAKVTSKLQVQKWYLFGMIWADLQLSNLFGKNSHY